MAWDKSHLITVYDSLDVLLDRVFQYLMRGFIMCSSVILACKCVCVFKCLISLSGFGIGVMLASRSWKSSSSCDFLEEFLKRKSVLNIHCKD